MGRLCCTTTESDLVRVGTGGALALKGSSNTQLYEQLPLFQSGQLDVPEKARLIIKFGIGSTKWTAPVSEIEKKFFAEVLILQMELARKQKKKDKVDLPKEHIQWLIEEAKQVFQKVDGSLVEIEAPLIVAGDFHGQFFDMLRIMDKVGGPPPFNKWIIMGDYVDRGDNSIETICLLLSYKVRYPEKMFMLRGNHECESITRIYGFYHECRRRYSILLYRQFCELFNYIPVAALIDDRILCMHGGLSPSLTDIDQIKQIERPQDVPDEGLVCDLLWADPREREDTRTGWDYNEDRGISVIFGSEIVKQFC